MSKRKYFDTSKSVRLSTYRDQHFKGSHNEQEKRLLSSSTLYVGNLAFYTREEQIHELFSRAGDVKRIVMGLDKVRRTPCGFCFVEFYTRPDAENAMRYVNGTRLDDRVVRTDWDVGFQEGRQYGRGKSGGQVRDEYRVDYDPGRGGYGKIIMQKMGQDDRMFTEPSVPVSSAAAASTAASVAAAAPLATPVAAGAAAAAVTTAAP